VRARRSARVLGLVALAVTAAAGADAATRAPAAIVIGNDAPAWSPDGTRIAFTSFRHGNGELYVMNADGSAQTRLTRTTAHEDHAAWSPDGRRIAFSSTRDGDYEIYVMDARGTNVVQLTDHPQSDAAPAWSPDGTRIAWRTNRDGNPEIYVMDADGGHPLRLTASPAADEAPDWSVGDRIAFASNRAGGAYNIWTVRPDGSDLRQLTTGRANRQEPSWSPDGSRLLYLHDRDFPLGNTEIYAVGADGTGDRRLTDYDGRDDFPSWSPDGSRIVFTRGVTFRAQDVYTADSEGGMLSKLTTTAAQLEVAEAATTQPRAGRAWTIAVLVQDARGLPLQRPARVCRAAVAGRPLRLASGSVRNGVVRCTWRIPASARGKLVSGTAGVRVGTLRAEQPFALRVR
jgi:Tol biopolymer transport system component